MKKLIEKTNNHKTTGLGLAYMLFQAFMLAKPDAVSPATENVIEYGLASGLFATLGHKFWRNRQTIWNYTKMPFLWVASKFKKSQTQ